MEKYNIVIVFFHLSANGMNLINLTDMAWVAATLSVIMVLVDSMNVANLILYFLKKSKLKYSAIGV